jgi:hypothetical protein
MGEVTDDEPTLNLIIERYLRVRIGKKKFSFSFTIVSLKKKGT